MLTLSEKAGRCGISVKHLWAILNGKSRPSYELSETLEEKFKINRLAWLDPQEFFNPEAPHLYAGPWPPDLSHLEGEARAWAERIVAAFPDGPPSKEEFRAWRSSQSPRKGRARGKKASSKANKERRADKRNSKIITPSKNEKGEENA